MTTFAPEIPQTPAVPQLVVTPLTGTLGAEIRGVDLRGPPTRSPSPGASAS